MKILPVMVNAIPFLLEDRVTVQRLPFQVFRGSSGMLHIRIGPNILVFDESGRFDGSEHKLGSVEAAEAVTAALDATRPGTPPGEAYYLPGTEGYAEETRDWKTPRAAEHVPLPAYIIGPSSGTRDKPS